MTGIPAWSSYAATKGHNLLLMEGLAEELMRDGGPPCGFGMQHSLFRPAPAKRPGNPERQVAGWDFMGLGPVIPHEVNDITDYAQES